MKTYELQFQSKYQKNWVSFLYPSRTLREAREDLRANRLNDPRFKYRIVMHLTKVVG